MGAILTVPRVTVTNSCSEDILASQTFPIIGEVTIDLVAGESKSYPILPGPYELNYDGQMISGRAPLVGKIGPYRAPGEIDAHYENEPIPIDQTLNDSVGLGGRREIVLCPSGR